MGREVLAHGRAVDIVAERRDQRDLRAEPGRRDRRVGALAAHGARQLAAGDRLPRPGQMGEPDDEVDVRRPDHDDVRDGGAHGADDDGGSTAASGDAADDPVLRH
jgi:hypothetical protein